MSVYPSVRTSLRLPVRRSSYTCLLPLPVFRLLFSRDAPTLHERVSVRLLVRPSVGPFVRHAFVKIAENGVMQDEDASYAVYTALFSYLSCFVSVPLHRCHVRNFLNTVSAA